MSRNVTIRSTEHAVAVIAAYATKVIAAEGYKHHDLEFVGGMLTANKTLNMIRATYTRHITNGKSVRDAVIATGQTVIAHYCNWAGIPTTR